MRVRPVRSPRDSSQAERCRHAWRVPWLEQSCEVNWRAATDVPLLSPLLAAIVTGPPEWLATAYEGLMHFH